MLRFDRSYNLQINDRKNNVEISSAVEKPLKIVFEVSKSIYNQLNGMNLQIYNLSELHSQAFVKDPEEQKVLNINLQIGYQNNLDTLYRGTVFRGFISKQGPDIINTIISLDGGSWYINGFVSRTVKTKKESISAIIDSTSGVTLGKVTKQQELIRPKVLVGNSGKLLQGQMNPSQAWVIDNGQLNILAENEYLGNKNLAPVVSAATGLLNTPERENKLVSFTTMMNPSIKIGGLCKLESVTAKYLNGIYKVQQIIYRGDNYGQDWTQTLTCTLAEGFNQL